MNYKFLNFKFKDIAQIFSGNSINEKVKEEKYKGLVNGITYISTKDIGFDSRINYENGISIPPSEIDNFKKAPEKTVFICAEGGSAGRKIAISDRELCFVNKLFAIVARNKVVPKYIYYYLKSDGFVKQFKNLMNGIIGGVSLNKFKEIDIKVPQFNTQQLIVTKLDTIFAEIDKATAAAETNAKNAEVLFQNHLSEVFKRGGENWEVYKIKDLIKIRSGDFLPLKNMNNEGSIDVYGGNGISGKHNLHNLSGDNIIIGRVGAKCGNVRLIRGNIWVTDNAFYVSEFKKNINKEFLSLVLKFKNLRTLANQMAQPVISFATIKETELKIPNSLEKQVEILKIKNLLELQIKVLNDSNIKKAYSLNLLKQSILKQAFNGELVKAA